MRAFLGARAPTANGGVAPELAAPAMPRLEAPATAPSPTPPAPAPVSEEAPDPAPASEPTPAAEAPAATTPPTRDPKALGGRLLELVSDRTGYPTDILDMDMDVEADLGIDSIKRVEILGAFASEYGISQDERMESIGELKTLRQMLDFLAEICGEEPNARAAPRTLSRNRPSFRWWRG